MTSCRLPGPVTTSVAAILGAEASDPSKNAMLWGSWAACVPVALLAVWMWLHGGRIARAGRYPAPGSKVIRDTPVLHGAAARLRGTALRLLAVVLGLLSAGTMIAVYRLVARLEG